MDDGRSRMMDGGIGGTRVVGEKRLDLVAKSYRRVRSVGTRK